TSFGRVPFIVSFSQELELSMYPVQAAHGLAKFALQLDDDCIWLEDDTPPISSITALD
ncbi:hypothetical protein TorRG33x02_300560, partial [Trema orientale]